MKVFEDPDIEATLEEGVRSFDSTDTSNNDEFGFPTTPPPPTNMGEKARPRVVQRGLTEVSKKYDQGGKGYLTEAERALRQIDRENKGYLDLSQVLAIMDSLQEEQKRSSELIDTIRSEHKKAVSMKRAVIILTLFVVMLCIANIGTSFVAARLVKDTKVDQGAYDLVSLDGTRLGTTSKQPEFSLGSVADTPDARRRHLQSMQQVACGNTPAGYGCSLTGVITFENSISLYQQFCPGWPNDANICSGDGVDAVLLNCNGVRSKILGGIDLPADGPSVGDFGWTFWVFPSQYGDYTVQERVYPVNATNWNPGCLLEYKMSLYCPTDGSECAVFASYNTTVCPEMSPLICGF